MRGRAGRRRGRVGVRWGGVDARERRAAKARERRTAWALGVAWAAAGGDGEQRRRGRRRREWGNLERERARVGKTGEGTAQGPHVSGHTYRWRTEKRARAGPTCKWPKYTAGGRRYPSASGKVCYFYFLFFYFSFIISKTFCLPRFRALSHFSSPAPLCALQLIWKMIGRRPPF